MRQYWINFNGKQEGPMTMEQMAQMGVDETAYVWHSGLPDWVKITKVPELNEMLHNGIAATSEQPEQDTAQPATQQDAAQAETTKRQEDTTPPLPAAQQVPPAMPTPQPRQQAMEEKMPECPPTNLVWAIIATLVCCTPAGIVGIVFAYLTKKHYRQGDYERAKKMSDRGAWAIIASIIIGLITAPLSCASQLAQLQ